MDTTVTTGFFTVWPPAPLSLARTYLLRMTRVTPTSLNGDPGSGKHAATSLKTFIFRAWAAIRANRSAFTRPPISKAAACISEARSIFIAWANEPEILRRLPLGFFGCAPLGWKNRWGRNAEG